MFYDVIYPDSYSSTDLKKNDKIVATITLILKARVQGENNLENGKSHTKSKSLLYLVQCCTICTKIGLGTSNVYQLLLWY